MQHVEALRALVARDHVAHRVVAHMAHMDAARRIGKHLEHVVFRPRADRSRARETAALVPEALPLGFGFPEIVAGGDHRAAGPGGQDRGRRRAGRPAPCRWPLALPKRHGRDKQARPARATIFQPRPPGVRVVVVPGSRCPGSRRNESSVKRRPRVTGRASCSSEQENRIAPPAAGAIAMRAIFRKQQLAALVLVGVEIEREREAAVGGAGARIVAVARGNSRRARSRSR